MDDALGQSSSNEPSMADLIASLDAVEAEEQGSEQATGDESDEQGGEEAEQQVEQPVFTVKVDGKEIQVTQDELLRGYQREADYTRKTQEVADQRRAFEKEAEGVRAKAANIDKQHEAVIGRLSMAENFLRANLGNPPSQELAARDPQQYLVLKAAYDERAVRLTNVHNALEQEKQGKAQSELQSAGERLALAEERLKQTVPGWSDPKKAAAGIDSLIGYVRGLGMTPEALSKQTDFAFWDLALKAQQFDRLQGMRAELKGKKTPASTTTARPGASQPNAPQTARLQAADKNWSKTRSVKDATDWAVAAGL